jgi:hypothetical protein
MLRGPLKGRKREKEIGVSSTFSNGKDTGLWEMARPRE